MSTKTRNTYISGTMADRMTIPTANLGFSTTPSSKKLTLGDCNNDRQIIWVIFCRAGHHRKSRIWRWNFDAICHSSTDIIISGFGGHVDISGCWSLLYLLAETIFHLYVVLYPRFVVEILTVLFTVSEI